LMQAFEGWAKEVGCKFASMCDMHDLQDLQPLYERKGYKLTEKSYVKEL